ncbi:sigma-70 family RNA polymerase sigma factor [Luteolibacter flavescens]|uniref:Sigma-70 family RNA polymerase sigma factor n=1 Tax=Luteolibacter flavescens TaxID=1859460 RepID=A0ABT3FP15_9BACT|nr:sigma-70 family RNA polymerase sigma factor [Luteolibacter flavescens]MCW1885006.1 sigma-70 family RNA polymerase sigma factor [Luteolibacter flavescens]
MSDRNDAALLEAWCAGASEEAFAALARRYGGLLYHAALRRTGRDDLAGEAAQNALLILARKAPRLTHLPSLSGWLHRTACYEASKILRREQRHHARMKHLMPPDEEGESTWKEIAPLLDEALDAMGEKDREVIFLKFFDGLSFEQMARRFGGEPAAWRQRGSRAIERLRTYLTRRGVAVSATVLTTGLGTSFTQAAPAAFLASLPSSASAASAALSWQTLTFHSIHLMKVKPAAALAAVLLLSLVPLGMQAMAISEARDRIGLLESAHATSPVAPSRQMASSSSRAGSAMNLVALADALLAAEQGDLVKRFTTERKIEAMGADELEALLRESAGLELGADQRVALVKALFRQYCRVAEKSGLPGERVMELVVLLAPAMTSGQGTLWDLAGGNLDRWVEADPDAAVAWYRQMARPGSSNDTGVLVARAFDALERRDSAEALAFYRSLPDAEKFSLIGGGGGADRPQEMLGLASEIADERLRLLSMNAIFHRADGRSPQEVRGWLAGLDLDGSRAEELLAIAASGPRGEVTAEDAARRIEWLRESADGLDVPHATGMLLTGLATSRPDAAAAILDAEWARRPDERMLATYMTHGVKSELLVLDAIPRAALISDPELRDSALRTMLLTSRKEEDARELARRGGLPAEEIDRLFSR